MDSGLAPLARPGMTSLRVSRAYSPFTLRRGNTLPDRPGKGHSLANPALGTKRICAGCRAKFYDLGKDPIVCPTCDTLYVIPKAPPPRGGRSSYPPRSVHDPNGQTPHSVRTLQEAEPPGVADAAE